MAISAYGGVSTYLVYLLCFAIVLPFSLSYVVDRENQATVFFLSRSDKKTYLRAKMSMCFIGGAILVALPLLVNLFLCAVTFPDTHTYYIGSYGTGNYARSLTVPSAVCFPVVCLLRAFEHDGAGVFLFLFPA